MARNTQFFNQALVTVILDGTQVTDFMSGDAVRINRSTEGSSLEIGLDKTTTTFSTDKSGTVELDLKGTSPALEKINRLDKAQKTAEARLFSLMIFTSAGEPIRCEGCSISSPGNISTGGKQASARTVTINCESITPQ